MSDLWSLCQFATALILLVIAVEAVTEILVSSALLDIVGLRPWLAKKALPDDPVATPVRWYYRAPHKLLTCGYCASAWVAFVAAWFMPGDSFGGLPWNNVLVKTFIIHRLANWLHVVYELVRRGRVYTTDAVVKKTLEITGPLVIKVERVHVQSSGGGTGPADPAAGAGDIRGPEDQLDPRHPEGGVGT